MSNRDHAASAVELEAWRKAEGWGFGAVGRGRKGDIGVSDNYVTNVGTSHNEHLRLL